VTATKDYTIQQKDAFQRKVQTELDEMQVRIRQLREMSSMRRGKQERDQEAIRELKRKGPGQ